MLLSLLFSTVLSWDFFFFSKECANSVIPSYIPLVEKNKDKGYSYADRQWQLLRRGRYLFLFDNACFCLILL